MQGNERQLNVQVQPKETPLQATVYRFRFALITFLVVMLMGLMVLAGTRVACKDGFIQGLQCVQPKVIETVKICELNTVNCAEVCGEFIIEDKGKFNEQLEDLAQWRYE